MILAPLLLVAAGADEPLAPTGAWILDYQPDNCVLAHRFGDPEHPVTVGWQAVPLAGTVEVLISEPRGERAFTSGAVAVNFGGHTGDGTYRSYPTSDPRKYMTRIIVERGVFVGDAKPVTASFRLQRGRTLSYTIEKGASGFAALQTCLDQTITDWNVDKKALAAVATDAAAVDGGAEWIKVEDYPGEEVRRGQQGISTLLWRVDTTGHVVDCRAVVPSGSKLLDDAGCAALTKRGRYSPARNAAGHAVDTYKVRRIVWSLPGGLAGR